MNTTLKLPTSIYTVLPGLKVDNRKLYKVVIHVVLDYHRLSLHEVQQPSRKREYADARMMIWYLFNEYGIIDSSNKNRKPLMTYAYAAGIFSKTRCSAIHGVKRIKELLEFDKSLQSDYRQIRAKIEFIRHQDKKVRTIENQ